MGKNYLWQSDIRDNDSVESTGGLSKRLVLVTVGVILVLEGLSTLILTLPGHGALANANIAFF